MFFGKGVVTVVLVVAVVPVISALTVVPVPAFLFIKRSPFGLLGNKKSNFSMTD